MWVKTTCCILFLSSFNKKLLLQCTGAILYQYAGCNLQRATTLSRSPASPGREQQPPLALVLAKILVRRCWPTEGYNLLFLPGTTFHKFSDWIHEHQSIIKNFCIKQSSFHQLALNQVDTSLTAIFKSQ